MQSKKKYIVLLVFSCILLFICYTLAFSKTFDVRSNYQKLSKSLKLNKDTPRQLQILSKKQVYYDSILTKMNLSSTSLENNLLKTLSADAAINSLKIKDFNAPHISVTNSAQFTTYNFTLEGKYNDILKAIYSIEQNGVYGEVIHLNFTREIDFRTRRKYLTVEVFIQNVGFPTK